MEKFNYVKRTHCPRCGSENLLTIGHDQMCMECDWDYFKLLVDLGQLDDLQRAAREHFGSTYKIAMELETATESNLCLEELPIAQNL